MKKLETDLEEAQDAHNEELENNERLIAKLTNQINQIQSTTAEVNKRIEKESQKRYKINIPFLFDILNLQLK